MKQTIDSYQFINAFEETRPNNFSREGLHLLFDYLENYEDETGEELELDVIAICCDYSEDTVNDLAQAYDVLFDADDTDEDKKEKVLDFLNDATIVVGCTDDTIIYQNC
jgi:hypothetical protein